jgi:hypothetical protein
VSFDDYAYRFAVHFDFMSVCESLGILTGRKLCGVAPRRGLPSDPKKREPGPSGWKAITNLYFFVSVLPQSPANLNQACTTRLPQKSFSAADYTWGVQKDMWSDSVMMPRAGEGMGRYATAGLPPGEAVGRVVGAAGNGQMWSPSIEYQESGPVSENLSGLGPPSSIIASPRPIISGIIKAHGALA